ncbi:MAG: AAA family ATPase, partial [Verrucomicrobiota bacterium]
PVVVVVGNRLGALNHAILTVKAVEAKGCVVRGVVLNQVQEEQDVAGVTNRGVLEARFGEQFVGEVMHEAAELEAEVLEGLGF